MHSASHQLDTALSTTLDKVGLVGSRFRDSLIHDLKAKIVLRDGRDPVEIVGEAGVGKHKVVEAAHMVASDLLGRRGPRINFDCGSLSGEAGFEAAIKGALDDAEDGTLVLDRYGKLDAQKRRSVMRAIKAGKRQSLVLRVTDQTTAKPATGTTISVKPLHEREEDVWELIDHFFASTVEDAGAEGCRGFSRQAKADIAEAVKETKLASVRRLRDIVRDVVFEVLAAGDLPLKLTSDHVRPYLEAAYGQTEDTRKSRDEALIESQFDSLVERSMLDRLSELHGVPADLLARQAQILRDLSDYIGDVPKSYRNIMDKAEDIERAALWLVSGATTQAEFRRFFGEERYMRPTKSVAWAFYNRVFKRDM